MSDGTTPRPWRILETTYGPIRVLDAHGNRACEISCAIHLTADDILRAVNSHDGLVKALENCVADLEAFHRSWTLPTEPTAHEIANLEEARSALSKAKGEA